MNTQQSIDLRTGWKISRQTDSIGFDGDGSPLHESISDSPRVSSLKILENIQILRAQELQNNKIIEKGRISFYFFKVNE